LISCKTAELSTQEIKRDMVKTKTLFTKFKRKEVI
jgi:hypothetical protein